MAHKGVSKDYPRKQNSVVAQGDDACYTSMKDHPSKARLTGGGSLPGPKNSKGGSKKSGY